MIPWILVVLSVVSNASALVPRSRHTSTLAGTTLYVVGGLSGNAQTNEFLSLDVSQPFTASQAPFKAISATNTPQISHHCTAPRGSNGDLVVYGGRQPTVTTNSVYVYDASTSTWTPDFTTPPTVKRYESSLAYDTSSPGTAWLFGGLADTTTVANINGTFVFNDLSEMKSGTSLFVRKTGDSNRPKARWDHQAVMLKDGRVALLGGVVQTGDATWSLIGMDVINLYNPSSNSWQTVTATGDLPSARRSFSAVVRDNKIIVYGGTSNDFTDNLDDVAVLDMDSSTWTKPVVGNNIPGRYSHSASMIDDKHMMVLFGTTASGQVNSAYVMDTDAYQFVESYSPYKSGLSVGAIIGIVIGSVVAFALLVLLSIFCFHRFIKAWWVKRSERQRLQREKEQAFNAKGEPFVASMMAATAKPNAPMPYEPPMPNSYIPSSNITPSAPAYVDDPNDPRWSQPSSLTFPSPPGTAVDYSPNAIQPQQVNPNYLATSIPDYQTPMASAGTYGMDGVLTPYFNQTPAAGNTPATDNFMGARPDSDISGTMPYTVPRPSQGFSAVGGVHRKI